MLRHQTNGFWLSDLRPKARPKRIISCVPSQTELLSDLGLEEEVIGITLFCIHPKEWHQSKTRIGGTKNLKVEEIKALQPDLILANKEENVKDQLEVLAKNFPVYVTDVSDYDSALQSITEIGKIVEQEEQANHLHNQIQESFKQLSFVGKEQPKVVYLIWNEPFMTVGGDTFISSMLEKAGFVNCYADATRYPVITANDIAQKAPDFIFLSSEPFPFQEKHKQQFVTILPLKRITIIDGESFSWYGSRMLSAVKYFEKRSFLQ